MSTQGQAWVDKVGITQCKNSGELLVLIRVGNHVGGDMRGCFAKAATLAEECLMGESTVLKHLRALKAAGVLLPGDEKLVDHIRADKRPPVYDLAGGHESGCLGGHPSDVLCETAMATGARSEHPLKGAPATGARSDHPQKKRRSAGGRSEHPTGDAGVTGVQIDAPRVFKSSGRSNKEVKLPLSVPAGGLNGLPSAGTPGQDERENSAAPEDNPAPAAAEVPAPRDGQVADEQGAELLEMLLGLPGRDRMGRAEVEDMLLPLAGEALSVGWTVPKLRNHLARGCDPDRVFNVVAIYRNHLKNLPSAPAGAGGHPAAAAPECSKCNGSGLAEDPETFLPIGQCECRKAPALAAAF
ncbi:hypothetical protein [Streptomyces sp. NPDC053813]|uniref:hypothetical protein n=1 Tax=Streptomyces sp. NPDC053813 TaxID=3365717 RepID=UPI0037D6A150